MHDLIKELNIIDILGIGVPGCLMVLLLGGDQTAQLLWMEQFQNNALAFGVVLIVVGSLVGMLIHELGDMIEKGLWLIPWLDPKVYAAVAVNLDSMPMEALERNKYPVPTGGIAKIIQVACAVAAGLILVFASILLTTAMWRAALPGTPAAYVSIWAWMGHLPLVFTAVAAFRYRKTIPPQNDIKWTKIQTIRDANPYIQTILVNHGNTSKRTLYDGWRFVMRNLILVLAISNLICLWKPLDLYRHVAEKMVMPSGSMSANLFWLTLMASCAISLMLVRYYHYAFLRYKYSLEDYMLLSAAGTAQTQNQQPAHP